MFYSPSTGGFYATEIHTTMPTDVVEINAQKHAKLMLDQSAGMRIQADLSGLPIAVPMPAAPATVPNSLPMRQARLVLLNAGLLDVVNAGIATMPQAAQIEWQFASSVDRTSPLVATLAATLNLDSAALDALFTAGAAL